MDREASWAIPSIAKPDYPAGRLVPSSEYKLHYLHILFGQKFFQRYKMNYRKKYVLNVFLKILLMCISCSSFFNTSKYNLRPFLTHIYR